MSNRATQFKNFLVKPRELTAVTTLSERDSGKTIFLNSATEFAVTLPKVKAGLNFTFIVKAAPSGASYTVVSDAQNLIYGQIYTSQVTSTTDADFNIYAASTITFADGYSVVGDRVELISDGTNWYARVFCSAYNGVTITVSRSASPSASSSVSPSSSTSASPSSSLSASTSGSPSASQSVSPSISKSASSSTSPSQSPSISPSSSKSASPSTSPSASSSVSPSTS